MKNAVIISDSDELRLIINALSAYQHNAQYRKLYSKLLDQVETNDARLPRIRRFVAA